MLFLTFKQYRLGNQYENNHLFIVQVIHLFIVITILYFQKRIFLKLNYNYTPVDFS